jgi:hypothetical protein
MCLVLNHIAYKRQNGDLNSYISDSNEKGTSEEAIKMGNMLEAIYLPDLANNNKSA